MRENGRARAINMLHTGEDLYVVAQPIVQIRDHQVMGYEFLARSRVNGYSSPDALFALAGEEKLLEVVDRHCIREAVPPRFRFQAIIT